MDHVGFVLWCISLLAESLLIVRLLHEGLHKVYPMFTLYVAADLTISLALISIDIRSPAYLLAWKLTRPLILALRGLVCYEAYARVCQLYPGIGRFRYTLAAMAAAISALLVWPTIGPELRRMPDQFVYVEVLAIRVIVSWLLAFLGFTLLFFRYIDKIHVPRSRNIVRHVKLLAAYFLVDALSALFQNVLSGRATYFVNIGLQLGAGACFVTWLALLSRAGEHVEELPVMPRALAEELLEEIDQEKASLIVRLKYLRSHTADRS